MEAGRMDIEAREFDPYVVLQTIVEVIVVIFSSVRAPASSSPFAEP
jgi:hypothetical protein